MTIAAYPWQEEVASSLNGIRNSLPNGLIIHGPRGIGLYELAENFSRSLLCESPAPDGTPCRRCPGCRLAMAGSHPDIRYVLSESEAARHGRLPPEEAKGKDAKARLRQDIAIQQPRDLIGFLSLTSHRSNVRVVIVDPADHIRPDAASVFLKMLEEPPPGVVFLLLANELDLVLPAIRSRCSLVRVLPPGRSEAGKWLEEQGVENPEIALAEAGGMPLAVLDTDESVVLPREKRDTLLKLLGQVQGSGTGAACLIDSNWTIPPAAVFLQKWAFDISLALEGLPPRYFMEKAEALARAASRLDRDAFQDWCVLVNEVKRRAGHTLNAKLTLEQVFIAYQNCLRRGP